MEVVAVSFAIERDKEVQEWKEQQMPKALLGLSGGKLPGRSRSEKGREEEGEMKEAERCK